MRRPRALDALLGLVYVGLAVALLTYDKAFVSSVDVDLSTGAIGNSLNEGSDVKLNGVPVGTVSRVAGTDDGAVLTLALDPETSRTLPQDTTARLLPKTLFGERYVSLVTPSSGSPVGLANGDSISQDRSAEAVELEAVLDELLPLLQSIEPDKLSATLGELATMLRGQGEAIGDTLSTSADYLDKLAPLVPEMTDDLEKLGNVAVTYGDAAPDLLAALENLTTTSDTLVDRRTELVDVYAQVITSADTTEGWVADNQQTIEVLSAESRDALGAAAPYARQFPCLFKAARQFIPEMDETLGKGTDEPGLHVELNVVESRGKYLPGRDRPTFSTGGQARCPYVTGRTGAQPASAPTSATGTPAEAVAEPEAIAPPPSALLRDRVTTGDGLGQANSPGENQFMAELLAPTQGLAPADYPQWSSLLVGPTLRDTKVTLR